MYIRANKADVVVRADEVTTTTSGRNKVHNEKTSHVSLRRAYQCQAGNRLRTVGQVQDEWGVMQCCAAKVEVSCEGTIAETSKLCDVSVSSMTMTVNKREIRVLSNVLMESGVRRMDIVTGGAQEMTLRGPAPVPASRRCAA
jgi:hypothetical protein